MTTLLIIVIAMLAMYHVHKTQTDGRYRCLRCGASDPGMHSDWCEDKEGS